MKKCNHCKLQVADNAFTCPLCQNVLENVDHEAVNPMYPQIEFNVHKFNIILRLFFFLSVLISAVLLLVNFLTYMGIWWAFIGIGAIIYVWITIKYSILNNTNSAMKIVVQTLGAQALTVLIDWSIGYKGWSVDYAIPSIFLVADLAVLILMAVNFMNWQSYIMFQILFVLFSLIPVIFYIRGTITHPLLTFLAAGSSLLILIGTMIFGDRSAKNELKRRFHI